MEYDNNSSSSSAGVVIPAEILIVSTQRVICYTAAITALHVFVLAVLRRHENGKKEDDSVAVVGSEEEHSMCQNNNNKNMKSATTKTTTKPTKETNPKSKSSAVKSSKSSTIPSSVGALKSSFQFINLTVNLVLSIVGIYYWFFILSKAHCTVEEKFMTSAMITQLKTYQSQPQPPSTPPCYSPGFLSEFQLSYQLWSIPVCILIGESWAMIVHHIFVTTLATISISFDVGCRYYNVFFFGVVEMSSVFLSIMNAFRARPHWVSSLPRTFTVFKLLFTMSFFITRVIWWVPVLLDFSIGAWAICQSKMHTTVMYPILLVLSYVAAAFLTGLQFFWAWKIVKGLIRMVAVSPSDDKFDGSSGGGKGKEEKGRGLHGEKEDEKPLLEKEKEVDSGVQPSSSLSSNSLQNGKESSSAKGKKSNTETTTTTRSKSPTGTKYENGTKRD